MGESTIYATWTSILFLHIQLDLTPLEVAILGMQDKIKSLKNTLQQKPPDAKLLQMQLQGGIATAVNQVGTQFVYNCDVPIKLLSQYYYYTCFRSPISV